MPELIPNSLRNDQDFRNDFERLISMPIGTLSDLVDVVAGQPMAEAGDLGLEEEDTLRVAYLLTYLARGIGRLDEDLDPKAGLMTFADEFGAREDCDIRWPVLERLLGRDTPYQRDVEARLAFRLEPGYEKVSFDVMLRPRRRKTAELVGGFHWTIQYHDPSGSPQVLVLQLAEGDVEEMIIQAQAALDDLQRNDGAADKRSSRGTRLMGGAGWAEVGPLFAWLYLAYGFVVLVRDWRGGNPALRAIREQSKHHKESVDTLAKTMREQNDVMSQALRSLRTAREELRDAD